MPPKMPAGYNVTGEGDSSGSGAGAPVRRVSLASATRDYARAVEAGIFERYSAAERAPWIASMGPDIWAWQRARLLTEQMPWRASPEVDEDRERVRAAIMMERDLPTWERALLLIDAQTERARRYGMAPPLPLAVPAAIMATIEAKRKAALERTTRARARGEGGGSPPALKPDDDLQHIPFPKPR